MPVSMDWITSPLIVIDRMLDDDGSFDAAKACSYFSEKIQADHQTIYKIPSLNDVASDNLVPNSLVRFRCMVQDVYNPELCLTTYTVMNKSNDERQTKVGLFRDVIDCPAGFEITDCLEHADTRPMDRQSIYCIPVPGESAWVKHSFAGFSQFRQPSMTFERSDDTASGKRRMEDNNDADQSVTKSCDMETDSTPCGNAESETPKRMKREDKSTDNGKKERCPDLNFPLPGETGLACLVKVYVSDADIKVNDMIEVIGILSVDPAMACFSDESSDVNSVLADVTSALRSSEGEGEYSALNPPPSLVPRLHAVHVRHLTHNNPLVTVLAQESYETSLKDLSTARHQLLAVLEMALLGDSLAAEYLLCHLMSSVYSRVNVVALGKFCLNITRCSHGLAEQLYNLISNLVTKSHYLPMSLSNMNNLKFVPRKDYTTNRLVTGLLQLPVKTHLVLDETALEAGKLEANGVHNMTALGNVISWQKVDYDFSFHQQSFPTDIITLIISEGKSILKSDCQVPLIPNSLADGSKLMEIFKGIDEYLTPALLAQIRSYLTVAQLVEYSIDAAMQKKVEEDFVLMRRESAEDMTVDDFHSLLTLARHLSLTFGHTCLTAEVWQTAKEMEVNRKLRLAATGNRN